MPRKKKTPAQLVIAELGCRGLARKLDVAPSTIMRWKGRNGLVPSKYHQILIRMSRGALTADDLVYGR